jgi:uncharacterized protein YggE
LANHLSLPNEEKENSHETFNLCNDLAALAAGGVLGAGCDELGAGRGGPDMIAPQPVSPPSTGLTVVGTGSVSVKPDRAFLSVGVQNMAPTATAAQTATNSAIASVLAALKALPVVQDVHTADVSLYPQLPQPDATGGSSNQPVTFQAAQTLSMTVKDPDAVGSVLDAAIKAGANTQVTVSFGLADPQPARGQALALAVADAKSTAQQAAQAAGLTLKGMTAMVVLPVFGGVPVYSRMSHGGATQIVPGSVDVSSAVQMTFGY